MAIFLRAKSWWKTKQSPVKSRKLISFMEVTVLTGMMSMISNPKVMISVGKAVYFHCSHDCAKEFIM